MSTAAKTPKTKTVHIVEDFASSPGRKIDREAGVIRGVKIIGFESKNGRVYPPQVLRAAVGVYEGVKVNINHPTNGDPTHPRGYEDRMGILRSSRFVDGSGIHADFHFNPKHRLTEQMLWDAENAPESLGFSHNAVLRFGDRDRRGRDVVEQIVAARSVDLVADPATTKSLFESENTMDGEPMAAPAPGGASDPLEMIVDSIAVKIGEIAKADGDPKAKMKSIAELLKKQDKIMALLADKPAEGDKPADAPAAESTLQREIAGLRSMLEQYQAKEKLVALEATIGAELKAAGLDATNGAHVSPTFKKQLLAIESAHERKPLIDDRAALVKAAGGGGYQTPVTSGANPGSGPALESMDWKQFANELRS